MFSTRPETLYGATFLVLAPEHPDAVAISTPEHRPAVEAYVAEVAGRNVLERMALDRAKTGVLTGAWATNPVDGRRLPVWVADYVVPGHGSGAIYATPAHDQRDWAFARAYGSARARGGVPERSECDGSPTGRGWPSSLRLRRRRDAWCNSGPYNGMTVAHGPQGHRGRPGNRAAQGDRR